MMTKEMDNNKEIIMTKESKHVVKFRENHLKQNEKIMEFVDGYIGETMGKSDNMQKNGSLIATTERAVFYRKGMLGEVLETIPINNINSIERTSGLLKHTLSLHGSGNRIVFKCLDKAKGEVVAKCIENQQNKKNEIIKSERTESNKTNEDAFVKIKKLAELKEMGIISESEFEEKKKILIAEI